MIKNAALGASDQNSCTFIGDMAASIFEALETYAIEYRLKIGNLLGRQLCAYPLKRYVRQGSSSQRCELSVPNSVNGFVLHLIESHVESDFNEFSTIIFLEPQAVASRYFFVTTRRIDMDWNRVEGNWKQVKGKIKEQWGKLTDDDLDQIAGKREQLEGKIQERYGVEKDHVRKDVDTWYDRQTW